jgi:hypothetical protein
MAKGNENLESLQKRMMVVKDRVRGEVDPIV